MKSEHANIGLLSCLCLIAVGIALLISAVTTTNWLVVASLDGDATVGLFKLCYKGHCVVYDDNSLVSIEEHLKIVRGLCVTAIILYGFALICMIIVALQKDKIGSKTLGVVCFGLSFVGGVLALAGVCHYVKKQEDHDADRDLYEYGYSLHLGWVSIIPVMTAGVMAIFVVNHYFTNRQTTTGHVLQGPPPPYAQNVMANHPGMTYPQPMNQPHTLRYDNQVMMSSLNDVEKRGSPSEISGGHLGSGSTSNYSGPQY